MKDKRVDILLETYDEHKKCNHCTQDQSCHWCLKMMKNGFPKKVNCYGYIRRCELEDD